jgi:hypothetical protein
MSKTYLQLVNEVLKRVREPQVESIDENTYSTLVASFINDAKSQVENAWEWRALRTPVLVNLVVDDYEYSTGLNEGSLLMYDPQDHQPLAWDITSSGTSNLFEIGLDNLENEYYLDTSHPAISRPTYFAVDYTASSPTIRLFEKPSEVRNWRFVFKEPQDELSDEADVLLVPWLPVVLLATNYALNEKGEEVGTPGTVAEQRYMQALTDAIQIDSRKAQNGYLDFRND